MLDQKLELPPPGGFFLFIASSLSLSTISLLRSPLKKCVWEDWIFTEWWLPWCSHFLSGCQIQDRVPQSLCKPAATTLIFLLFSSLHSWICFISVNIDVVQAVLISLWNTDKMSNDNFLKSLLELPLDFITFTIIIIIKSTASEPSRRNCPKSDIQIYFTLKCTYTGLPGVFFVFIYSFAYEGHAWVAWKTMFNVHSPLHLVGIMISKQYWLNKYNTAFCHLQKQRKIILYLKLHQTESMHIFCISRDEYNT